MKIRFPILICLMSAVLIGFYSCSKSTVPAANQLQDPSALYSHRWTLKELPGSRPYEGKPPTLNFTANPDRMSGFTGCNSYTGAFMLAGSDSLLFGVAAVSERMCMNANPEREYLAAMKRTCRYEISGHELRLYDGTSLLAVFTGEEADNSHEHHEETVTLDGAWELEFITGHEGPFEQLYPKALPFLTIDKASGKSGGTSGCNGFSASFTLKGNSIRFSDPVATKMSCPGNGEQTFFNALKQVDNFTMENDLLHLKKGGETMMRFHRKH